MLNPRIMNAYQEAFTEKKKQEAQIIDLSAYYNGIYCLRAIGAAFSKSSKYPSHPYNSLMDKEEQEEAEPLSEAEQFKLWALCWNKKFEEKEH